MSNEKTYSDYIKELVAKEGDIALNPEWVIKILSEIFEANNAGLKINPEYLRASCHVWITGQPFPPKETWQYCKNP